MPYLLEESPGPVQARVMTNAILPIARMRRFESDRELKNEFYRKKRSYVNDQQRTAKRARTSGIMNRDIHVLANPWTMEIA